MQSYLLLKVNVDWYLTDTSTQSNIDSQRQLWELNSGLSIVNPKHLSVIESVNDYLADAPTKPDAF